MIIGIGIDITDQSRIENSLTKHGDHFSHRLFTLQEIAICQRYRSPVERYAGKFAAKEALMKALGTGFAQQVTFKDIEVLNRDSGAPYITPHGQTAEIIKQLEVTQIHLSISHSAGVAVAVVILEK